MGIISESVISLLFFDLAINIPIQALGCLYYALCFLSHPFQDAGNLGILGAKVTIPKDDNVSADAKSLIPRMLDVRIGVFPLFYVR